MQDFTGNGLEFETESSFKGKAVVTVMVVLFFAASALSTFSFFSLYAPGIGGMFGDSIAWLVAGAVGVLLLDFAGGCWGYAALNHADSTKQISIAHGSAFATIGSSVVVSGLYIVFTTDLAQGLLASGNVAMFLDILGVVIMAGAFAGNFAAVALYMNSGSSATEAAQRAKLAAYMRQGQHTADQARAEGVIKHTLGGIMKELPQLTLEAGKANSEQYAAQHFAKRSPVDAEPTERPSNPPTLPDTETVKVQRVNPDNTRENLPDKTIPVTYTNGNGTNGTRPKV